MLTFPFPPPPCYLSSGMAHGHGAGTTPSVSGEPLNGRWELVYSDVAPFRASPFFLTIGKLFGTQSSAEDFFRLHRLATSGSEIGRVFQILGETEMSSEVSGIVS